MLRASVFAAGLGAIPDTAEEQAKRQKRMARFQAVEQPAAPGTIKASSHTPYSTGTIELCLEGSAHQSAIG